MHFVCPPTPQHNWSPFFRLRRMNSSSGSVWMLTRLASIFWQVFCAVSQSYFSEVSL